jgi:vacuolar-type H+-ATPase subunit E/Vma4
METLGSIASVIAAIRDEAGTEVEKLERAVPVIAPEAVSIADRDARIAAAHRENRERIAQEEWESRRAVIQQREAWIARVREAAHQRWGAMPWQPLAEEALQRITGEEVNICHPERSEGPGGASGAMVAPDKRKITYTPAKISGGCIAVSGGVAFDNTFEARERRLEAEWRHALSALYRT